MPQLGRNAQALRFLELLSRNTITVEVEGMILTLPHPANFGLHKLLVLQRRPTAEKAMKDMEAATRVLNALVEKGEAEAVKSVFNSIPKRWQGKIKKAAKELPKDLSAIFE